MAPPKMAKSKLKRSAKYYRENPEAREKKKKTDTKINKRPSQKKKQSELKKARAKYKKRGVSLKGKDVSHTKNWLRLKDSSKNRGSKTDAPWDRKARGSKKKKTWQKA